MALYPFVALLLASRGSDKNILEKKDKIVFSHSNLDLTPYLRFILSKYAPLFSSKKTTYSTIFLISETS